MQALCVLMYVIVVFCVSGGPLQRMCQSETTQRIKCVILTAVSVCLCVCVRGRKERERETQARKVTSRARFGGTAPGDCAREAKHQQSPKDNKVLIREKKEGCRAL